MRKKKAYKVFFWVGQIFLVMVIVIVVINLLADDQGISQTLNRFKLPFLWTWSICYVIYLGLRRKKDKS